MAPAPQKAIKRALRSAAAVTRLPARGRGGRVNFSPAIGESPFVVFRIQVIGCKDLLAKDRNGFSDPFVVVSVLSTRQQTPVSKRNVNPTYAPKDATFDFPLYHSLADKLGSVELVVWDKDMIKKDYLGEVALPLDDWFKGGRARAFDDPDNKPFETPILSTRASTPPTGTMQLKLGFAPPPGAQAPIDFDAMYHELVKLSRPSLVSAPPTAGIGTVRSHEGGPDFEDDGGLSSDEEDDEEEEDAAPALARLYVPPPRAATLPTPASPTMVGQASIASLPTLVLPPSPPLPTSPSQLTPTPASAKTKPLSPSFIPKIFPRRAASHNTPPATLDISGPSPSPSGATTPTGHQRTASGEVKKRKFAKFGNKKADYNFSAANDIVGIVMLEVQGATDLPRLKNMTRTGWDMDPFVVISFGKKVFRTRVIRHSRNPVWDEKLLFHVRRYETAFKVQLSVLDWDKLSSNDYIGETSFDLTDLVADAPQPDPVTGLYDAKEDGNHAMKEYKLPISTAKDVPWESKYSPILTFRAKYQPYDALRQRFWRQYLKQYDTEDTGGLSHLELTSMLDSLGSTLTRSTVDSFFTRNGKKPHADDLTLAEAIQCLETELGRPNSEKRRVDTDDSPPGTGAPVTPLLQYDPSDAESPPAFEKLDFSGQKMRPAESAHHNAEKPAAPAGFATESNEVPLIDVANGTGTGSPTVTLSGRMERSASGTSSDAEESGGSNADDSFERVINVKNCPLCHRPRLNAKAEVDIVTHLAVCASQDWEKVDRIVVGNYVTASQAQRKWYTRIISKVSSGDYRLGANSANIIVQNRMTGQLEEEKMQVYVRLGIRLLYKGAKSRMEGARARKLLKSLSIKQGIKYDSPESVRDIPTFIEFHNLPVDEILDPLDSFKTFNEFFYRKLKPSARPVESPDDPYRLVSGADCRLMSFESVNEATRLWIKGREFTVARLLGDAYRAEAERYTGGALAIFRLAPQDYHRFHSPVNGTIGPITSISGEYYTVNPQAIRTALDVYGENVRNIVPIDSPQFGRVMAVCIGAMMVGSIKMTVQEGDRVARGQEFGYFAFGGSTIVLLFERGVVEWDEDLLINGRASLETLVRVGMGIGRGTRR